MSALFASLRDVRRELGTVGAIAAAARWLVRVSFDVFVFEHGDDRAYPPRPSLDGLRLTAIGEGDVDLLVAMNPALARAELLRRLAEGVSGTIVWEGDEPVHVRWEAKVDHRLPYLGLIFRLHPGDLHRQGSYTRPDRRDRGLHQRLVAWSLHAARDQGLRRSLGLVASWNVPARRSVLRTGWRKVGTIGVWRLAPFRRYVATGAVRLGPGRSFSVDPEAPDAGS